MINRLRTASGFLTSVGLLAAGYLLGASQAFDSTPSAAQSNFGAANQAEGVIRLDLSNQTVLQIQSANEALTLAMEALRAEGKYNPATTELNSYAILSGELDAIGDLERGQGVDPITYAQLYTGKAVREVSDELTRDAKNRLLYKNQLIRMYSVERMMDRQAMAEEIQDKRVNP